MSKTTKTNKHFENSVRYWSDRGFFKSQVLEIAAEELKMTTRQRDLARRKFWAKARENGLLA